MKIRKIYISLQWKINFYSENTENETNAFYFINILQYFFYKYIINMSIFYRIREGNKKSVCIPESNSWTRYQKNNNIIQGKKLKKVQNNKIANVAGSVWLSLFMDGSGTCKLQSTYPRSGISRIQYLNMVFVNFEFEYYHFWILGFC